MSSLNIGVVVPIPIFVLLAINSVEVACARLFVSPLKTKPFVRPLIILLVATTPFTLLVSMPVVVAKEVETRVFEASRLEIFPILALVMVALLAIRFVVVIFVKNPDTEFRLFNTKSLMVPSDKRPEESVVKY